MKSKNITIRDIAKFAGVSVATVSRVVNGNESVAADLREKVNKAIAEYGYYPNMLARGLKNDSTQTIALLIADSSNEHYLEIIQSIEEVIREDNYTLFVSNSHNGKEAELNYLRMLTEKQVDGIIINASGHNNEYIAQLSYQIPMVLLYRRLGDYDFKGDFVDSDFGSSAYTLTMELIAKGHRRIGIFSGPTCLSSASERFNGFQQAMKTIGVRVTNRYEYYWEGPFTTENGYLMAEKAMTMQNPPTALVIMHCETTLGALRYFRSKHIRIPEDISFVSPCNISQADLLYVEPTYSNPNTRAIGKRSAEMLMERIKKQNNCVNREAVFNTILVYGNSVAQVMPLDEHLTDKV